MLLGRAGTLPGPLAPELVELAKREGKEFYDGNPQDNYPDALDSFRKEMEENNWLPGDNEEELFELAMHDRQYRDYKSGVARTRFLKEVEDKRAEMMQGGPAKISKKQLLLAPHDGTVLIYTGTTSTYSSDEELIATGDEVRKDEILMYLMLGKSISDVRSDRDGVVSKVLVRSGDKVKKGDPLVEFR